MDMKSLSDAVNNVTDFSARKQRWADWMSAPENRAMLLQTGISLLQGPVAGQSQWSQLGTAIGQGAAARDRVIQGERDQAQTAAELKLKQAQGDQAQQRIGLDKQELDLRKQELQDKLKTSESLRDYRSKLGLSSVLRAQKAGTGTAAKGPNKEARWLTYSADKAILEDPTDENIMKWRTEFERLWDAGAIDPGNMTPGAPDTSSTGGEPAVNTDGSVLPDGTTGRKDGKAYKVVGGKWLPQ